ncbi:hypothetical protein NPIL_548811 [Nephila pilipes]|uniref:Uncharacterized protein n=1 Tax=Nephila pilipes TaxID=299642 RepID=A0A8X6QXU8_NEPPI|nr:hypothetical protein NPIL_548811 [Nephila pilipes]
MRAREGVEISPLHRLGRIPRLRWDPLSNPCFGTPLYLVYLLISLSIKGLMDNLKRHHKAGQPFVKTASTSSVNQADTPSRENAAPTTSFVCPVCDKISVRLD